MGLRHRLILSSWNIEGLTDLKVEQIIMYMRNHSIDIICIQETRKINSDHYDTDSGYAVYLSGSSSVHREWAGVGFIVSPYFKHHIVGFNPWCNRICTLKMRVVGGTCCIFSLLAPHNLKPLADRTRFYDDLAAHVQGCPASASKYFLGDFNARIGQRRAGEEQVLGDYCFGREAAHKVEVPNRDLLLEFCYAYELSVANSFCENPLFAKSLIMSLLPSQWIPLKITSLQSWTSSRLRTCRHANQSAATDLPP